VKKLSILCFISFSLSLLSQENNNSSQKTYVLEYFNNICLVEVVPGSGFIDSSCNAQNYPEENPNDSNMRYKVPPDGNKKTWAVYEIQEDGSKKKVQYFYLNNATSANPDYSFVDVTNGKINLYTNDGYAIYNPTDNTVTISQDGFVATNTGVIFRDVNISNIIREESDGTIHIGENSLVTAEKDGVQLLYATDANDEQIDINIKAGTDLLVDGKSVTQALTDIDTNKTNIATNTTNIATNATGIATNKTNIATNTTNIATNATGIATNKTNIATNTTNIATNTAGIATNKTNIATNTTNIATNTAGIATNKTNIATNTTNIATNTTGIANNVVRLDNLAALAASNASRVEGLETLTGLMQNEYRSGIASSIALSQIQYAASGFSIGVGHGEFKNKDEMAVGIGYGGQFNEDVGFQFQFGTSGDSTGFGFTVNF
jgi:hypothetical protein